MWEMGHKEFGRYYNYSEKKFSIETDELITYRYIKPKLHKSNQIKVQLRKTSNVLQNYVWKPESMACLQTASETHMIVMKQKRHTGAAAVPQFLTF